MPTYTYDVVADTAAAAVYPTLLLRELIAGPGTAVLSRYTDPGTQKEMIDIVYDVVPPGGEPAVAAVVAAHDAASTLDDFKDNLVLQLKAHRKIRLDDRILAEYPAASGKFFSCSAASQSNWSKLHTLDSLGLVTYPFTVTTFDERDSHGIANSLELANMIGTVSAVVIAERTLAQTYVTAVLTAASTAAAQTAADPYLAL